MTDLFGTNERDINKAGLMDRLNVSSKGRGYVPVEFSDEESPLIKEAMAVKTWDDVVDVCKKLYDFIEENKEEEKEEEDMPYGMPSATEVNLLKITKVKISYALVMSLVMTEGDGEI